MKNHLQRHLLCLLFLTISGLLTAQTNLLPPGFFDFEDPNGWFIHADYQDYISITDERAATGTNSLKFNFDDYGDLSDGTTSIFAQSRPVVGAKVDLTAGDYYIRIKVFIESNPPTQLRTVFHNHGVITYWDLTEVEHGKWVELLQTVTLPDDIEDGIFRLQVFQTAFTDMEGSGTFYVDDIEIFEPVDLGTSDIMDLNHFSFEGGSSSWWIPPASSPYAGINHLQAASGLFAMQYSFDDYSIVYNKIHVTAESRDVNGLITLERGKEYEIKFKIFMVDEPGFVFPIRIQTNVKAAGGSGYQNINWDLDTISQRGEWVELTQIIKYTGSNLSDGQIVSRELTLRIPNTHFPTEGSGTFYVDDISFTDPSAAITYILDLAVDPVGIAADANVLGAGDYEEGTVVQISASAVAGYDFTGWLGSTEDVALLADASSMATSLTMPERNVSLTATYKEEDSDPDPDGPYVVNENASWSGLEIPTDASEVIVNSGHFIIDQDVTPGTITIKPSASVTLSSGTTMTVDKMVFESSSPSAAVASFINEGTLNVTDIEFSRFVPANAFEYFSSPLTGQLSGIFGPLSGVHGQGRGLFTFDPIANAWVWLEDNGAATINPLQGFAFISDAAVNITFSGTNFNEGDQTIGLRAGANNFNLVGNPYPSSVDWSADGGWVRDDINPNIWINLANAPNNANFATYSHATGVGTNWGAIGGDVGVIPPTQAFWVYAEEDNVALTVNPDARVHSANVPKSMSSSHPLIRLQAARNGYTDEMVVLFHPEAEKSVDQFDTRKKLGGGAYPQVYMPVGNDLLAVNALPSSMLENDVEIQLSLLSEVTGNVSISMTELKGFGETWKFLLVDKATGDEINLKDTENFLVEVNSKDPITDRFKLIIRSVDVSTSSPHVSSDILTEIFAAGRIIHIDKAVTGSQIEVYSINGSMLLKETLQSNGLTTIHTNLPTGIYVVVVNTGEGKIAKKVFLE